MGHPKKRTDHQGHPHGGLDNLVPIRRCFGPIPMPMQLDIRAIRILHKGQFEIALNKQGRQIGVIRKNIPIDGAQVGFAFRGSVQMNPFKTQEKLQPQQQPDGGVAPHQNNFCCSPPLPEPPLAPGPPLPLAAALRPLAGGGPTFSSFQIS